MSEERRGFLASRWGRLSTGPKMLLILSLALLPLGIIAILASLYSARENSEQRAEQTLARLEEKSERLNDLLARTVSTVQAANAAIAAAPPDTRICETALRRLAGLQAAPGRYALFESGGRLRCASTGFRPEAASDGEPSGQSLEISQDGEILRLTMFDPQGDIEAVVEFGRQALRDLTFIPGTRADFDLQLVGDGRSMQLRDDYHRVPLVRTLTDTAPIAGDRLQLRIVLGAVPVRAIDFLLMALPVMMWLAAGLIGWWVVNRQLLRPLGTIQRVVSSYRPGDRPLELPTLRSPAREIGELGFAFDQVTRTVARHEAELEAAVERQAKLVREVHHRVKNNLQVVASLLNLHSRGSTSEEAAAAYASIQRRVDALAVVHRNHYAELEENRGVGLRPLISELGANLRATAPPAAAAMQMRLDIQPLHVTQDVAVSVAFLVTEITEFGMLCGAGLVSIVLETAEPGTARLAIEADSLAGEGDRDQALEERFDRIITGLARQLRSPLERDPARGRYAVTIGVLERNGG